MLQTQQQHPQRAHSPCNMSVIPPRLEYSEHERQIGRDNKAAIHTHVTINQLVAPCMRLQGSVRICLVLPCIPSTTL